MEYPLNALTTNKCDRCKVHHRAICGGADPALQADLNRLSHHRTFKAGETIIAEGDEGTIIGNVVEGVLRLQKTMADGRQQIVGLLLPSDMFGRIFARASRFAIEAATDVTLCCFDRAAFEGILSRHHELEHEMLVASLDELDAARDWMLLLGCQTVIERIASFFIILARRAENQACADHDAGAGYDGEAAGHRHNIPGAILGIPVAVPIKRRDMASYLGTTVETISRIVQHLSRRGVLSIVDPQHFVVLDWDRLVRLSGRDEFADGHPPIPAASVIAGQRQGNMGGKVVQLRPGPARR